MIPARDYLAYLTHPAYLTYLALRPACP